MAGRSTGAVEPPRYPADTRHAAPAVAPRRGGPGPTSGLSPSTAAGGRDDGGSARRWGSAPASVCRGHRPRRQGPAAAGRGRGDRGGGSRRVLRGHPVYRAGSAHPHGSARVIGVAPPWRWRSRHPGGDHGWRPARGPYRPRGQPYGGGRARRRGARRRAPTGPPRQPRAGGRRRPRDRQLATGVRSDGPAAPPRLPRGTRRPTVTAEDRQPPQHPGR